MGPKKIYIYIYIYGIANMLVSFCACAYTCILDVIFFVVSVMQCEWLGEAASYREIRRKQRHTRY